MAVALCVPGPLKVKAKSSRNPRLTSKAFFFYDCLTGKLHRITHVYNYPSGFLHLTLLPLFHTSTE